ncbi:PHP domain-containing protein [Actinoplanes sp. NBRC 101535]|uniref:PHP domain-containing protein n=1 Tax=Actinoplanes sp. NBRC 101535 TaxID=3032196 RepID=UPI00249FBBD5|nr:PHP domain-containing protein [Actinoplanes sp. NBRC 101535]GLY02686.1 histidinol-phosphatase [Actinoplanes sp. NBRC 101535]
MHSEWSWDTTAASMERTCARALHIGLPAVAFTEHFDHTVWRIAVDGPYKMDNLTRLADDDGVLTPPVFDSQGYLAAVERCRELFPGLRILSGVEVGEPHWHAEPVGRVLAGGGFDRVLGSLHCLPDRGSFAEPWLIFPHRDAREVMREYLGAVATMAAMDGVFEVLAHIDYPLRFWPAQTAGVFDPADFEEEFRHALRITAGSGRALEVNTRLPMDATILRWWHQEGGEAITFGSDAHTPDAVGHGFAAAAHMAEAYGFRPGADRHALWGRVD